MLRTVKGPGQGHGALRSHIRVCYQSINQFISGISP